MGYESISPTGPGCQPHCDAPIFVDPYKVGVGTIWACDVCGARWKLAVKGAPSQQAWRLLSPGSDALRAAAERKERRKTIYLAVAVAILAVVTIVVWNVTH
jgi:hypothetical protein